MISSTLICISKTKLNVTNHKILFNYAWRGWLYNNAKLSHMNKTMVSVWGMTSNFMIFRNTLSICTFIAVSTFQFSFVILFHRRMWWGAFIWKEFQQFKHLKYLWLAWKFDLKEKIFISFFIKTEGLKYLHNS